MPKLTAQEIIHFPLLDDELTKEIKRWLALIESEQGKEISFVLCVLSLRNQERFLGFLFAYQLISKKIKEQLNQEVENILRDSREV